MSTELVILIVVAVVLILSATSPYWRPNPNGEPPTLNLGGLANTLLYVILVIFLVKVLLGLHPL
jgi:hypothetical protein